MVPQDFGVDCDLLIIMGTSLLVQPFASLIDRVDSKVPRLLINKEKAGKGDALLRMLGLGGGMLYDDEEHNYRDVFSSGTCDYGCLLLAEMCGWKDELNDMIRRECSKIDGQSASTAASTNKKTMGPNFSTPAPDGSSKK